MEQITLGDIARIAAFIAGLGGSIAVIIAGVQKAVKKLLESIQSR